MTDKEFEEWRLQQIYHERGSGKGRYRAEIRHPLKARRLDEPVWVFGICYRPAEMLNPKKIEMPQTAKCGVCGEQVEMTDRTHGCWNHRVPGRKARG